MNTNKRSFLMAFAFAATVAAGLTGLSMSGQTKELSLDDACAHTAWPMIPAACLAGADNGPHGARGPDPLPRSPRPKPQTSASRSPSTSPDFAKPLPFL